MAACKIEPSADSVLVRRDTFTTVVVTALLKCQNKERDGTPRFDVGQYNQSLGQSPCPYAKYPVCSVPHGLRSSSAQRAREACLHTWGSNLFYHRRSSLRAEVWREWRAAQFGRVQGIRKGLPVPCPGSCSVPSSHATSAPQVHSRKSARNAWRDGLYSRPPAKGVRLCLNTLVKYFISNSRIKNYTSDGMVTYDWIPCTTDANSMLFTAYPSHAFVRRRLSLHILPKAFVRIRHSAHRPTATRCERYRFSLEGSLCPRNDEEEILPASMR